MTKPVDDDPDQDTAIAPPTVSEIGAQLIRAESFADLFVEDIVSASRSNDDVTKVVLVTVDAPILQKRQATVTAVARLILTKTALKNITEKLIDISTNMGIELKPEKVEASSAREGETRVKFPS